MRRDRVKAEVHRRGRDYFVIGAIGEEILFRSEYDAWEYLVDHHPAAFTVHCSREEASVYCSSVAMAKVMMRSLGVFGLHPEHRKSDNLVFVGYGYGGIDEAMEALGVDEDQAEAAMLDLRKEAMRELEKAGFSVEME